MFLFTLAMGFRRSFLANLKVIPIPIAWTAIAWYDAMKFVCMASKDDPGSATSDCSETLPPPFVVASPVPPAPSNPMNPTGVLLATPPTRTLA